MAESDKDNPSSASANQGAEPKNADSQDDKKAADAILDARKSAVDNIMAGRPAPYFLADAGGPTQRPENRRDQQAPARADAHLGVWWYLTNAVWIIVFVVLCAVFVHEV